MKLTEYGSNELIYITKDLLEILLGYCQIHRESKKNIIEELCSRY